MIRITGEEAKQLSDSIEKIEEEIESSEPIQRFIKMSGIVKAYNDRLNQELAKRGYSSVREVKEDGLLAEILDAAGPIPDPDNI